MTCTHAKLRALALAATQAWTSGVWIETDGNEWRATGPGHDGESHDHGSEPGCPDDVAAQRDAEFIRAASPSTVIALLDEIERLNGLLAESKVERDGWEQNCDVARADTERLRGEVERMTIDARRRFAIVVADWIETYDVRRSDFASDVLPRIAQHIRDTGELLALNATTKSTSNE